MNRSYTYFRVACINPQTGSIQFWLGQDGYSKYYERLTQSQKNPEMEVYGYDQCVEHIKEYFATKDEYSEKRNRETLIIEATTKIKMDRLFNSDTL